MAPDVPAAVIDLPLSGLRCAGCVATVEKVLAEMKPGRELHTNVEYWAGVVMEQCGLPRSLFTPTFAASRVIGWCAQVIEQTEQSAIIRPSARYVGPPAPEPVPDAA